MPEPHPRSERVLRVAPSVFLLLLMLAGMGYGFYHFFGHRTEPPPVVSNLGPTITKVEKLGLLTVLRVSASDVLEMEGFGYKGAWLVKGDGLLAVDMSKMKVSEQNEEHKLVTITLPEPEVLQPRVDHEKTRTYDVKGNWFTLIPGWGNESKLRDAAMYEAQELVEFAVDRPEYIKQAKNNAELMLQNIFGFSGWYITIKWKGDGPKTIAPAAPEMPKPVETTQTPAAGLPVATR